MLRSMLGVTMLGCLCLLGACSDDDTTATGAGAGGEGAEGGEGGASEAGAGGEAGGGAGAAGEGGAGMGGACPEDGAGSVELEVTGLPEGVDANATLSGPDGDESITESITLDDLSAGAYELSAERVLDSDPLVRGLYEPSVDPTELCLEDGATESASIEYALVPTSNKLWILNDGPDASLLGYASADLMASGSPDAAVVADAVAGNDVAFDRDGNLWTFGPTTVDPSLVMYAAGDLATSGEKERAHALDVQDIACIPGLRAMAFDPDGNLWLSACGGELKRLAAAVLGPPTGNVESVEADVVVSGLVDNRDIAFDADGNLWVAADGQVVRFDAARLEASDSEAPDRVLTLRTAADTQDIGADYLAFDTDGDLWIADFGGNFLAEIAEANLAGTGAATVIAEASLVLSISALLNRPAFDDEGGLWISYRAGSVARIAPADLAISTGAGDPTVPAVLLEGGEIANTANVAFFPAPAGLPLYHALP